MRVFQKFRAGITSCGSKQSEGPNPRQSLLLPRDAVRLGKCGEIKFHVQCLQPCLCVLGGKGA